jgi:hypothetical protein
MSRASWSIAAAEPPATNYPLAAQGIARGSGDFEEKAVRGSICTSGASLYPRNAIVR